MILLDNQIRRMMLVGKDNRVFLLIRNRGTCKSTTNPQQTIFQAFLPFKGPFQHNHLHRNFLLMKEPQWLEGKTLAILPWGFPSRPPEALPPSSSHISRMALRRPGLRIHLQLKRFSYSAELSVKGTPCTATTRLQPFSTSTKTSSVLLRAPGIY